MKNINVLSVHSKAGRAAVNSITYIGRGDRRFNLDPSPLGNPYKKGDPLPNGKIARTPGETLPFYRKHLWKLMNANDKDVLEALRAVYRAGTAVCYCTNPSKCHGSIVAAAANWLHDLENPQEVKDRELLAELAENHTPTHTEETANDYENESPYTFEPIESYADLYVSMDAYMFSCNGNMISEEEANAWAKHIKSSWYYQNEEEAEPHETDCSCLACQNTHDLPKPVTGEEQDLSTKIPQPKTGGNGNTKPTAKTGAAKRRRSKKQPKKANDYTARPPLTVKTPRLDRIDEWLNQSEWLLHLHEMSKDHFEQCRIKLGAHLMIETYHDCYAMRIETLAAGEETDRMFFAPEKLTFVYAPKNIEIVIYTEVDNGEIIEFDYDAVEAQVMKLTQEHAPELAERIENPPMTEKQQAEYSVYLEEFCNSWEAKEHGMAPRDPLTWIVKVWPLHLIYSHWNKTDVPF